MALILVLLGCYDNQPTPIRLDSALGTHFSLIQNGDTGSARVRLRQFLAEHGESSQPLFLMGLSYHHDSQYSNAAFWFEKAVSTEYTERVYPPAWHFLGWSHYYLGHVNQSKTAFEHFLILQPKEEDSLFALGLIATEEGNLDEARKLFNQSIHASQEGSHAQAKAKARLADVYVEYNDWQHALPLFREAVNQNPDLYEAWYKLAMVLRRVEQFDESEQALKQFELSRRRMRPDLYTSTRFPE